MEIEIRIGETTVKTKIDRVIVLNAVMDELTTLEDQLKRHMRDRITWDDVEGINQYLEQWTAIRKLKYGLKQYKYKIPDYYPQEDEDEEDLGLTSLFG